MPDLDLKSSVQAFMPVRPGFRSRVKTRVRLYVMVFLAWFLGFIMGAALMYCKLAVHVLNRLGMFGQ